MGLSKSKFYQNSSLQFEVGKLKQEPASKATSKKRKPWEMEDAEQ